jgi:hypothetical protein
LKPGRSFVFTVTIHRVPLTPILSTKAKTTTETIFVTWKRVADMGENKREPATLGCPTDGNQQVVNLIEEFHKLKKNQSKDETNGSSKEANEKPIFECSFGKYGNEQPISKKNAQR